MGGRAGHDPILTSRLALSDIANRWNSGLHEPHRQRPARSHPRRRLPPLPRLPRPRREPARAHRATAGSASSVRLPSERDLTAALDVSRTTVTRAYEVLRESGYAEARRGSGTFTPVPGGRRRAHDRVADARPRRRGRHRPQLRGALRPARPRRGLPARHRASCRPTSAGPATSRSGVPAAPDADRGGVRRPRAADRARADHGHRRRAGRGVGRGAGVHRTRRAGRRRVADLPQRDPGGAARRRPARRRPPSTPTAGTSTRSPRPCARPRRGSPT